MRELENADKIGKANLQESIVEGVVKGPTEITTAATIGKGAEFLP